MDHRAIMNGERNDAVGVMARGALGGAAVFYRLAVGRRNRRYDSGAAQIHRCGVPVVSVGNLTTGGTGKTPIVCHLARWYRDRGVRVAIVSRGYGRGESGSNDEALELYARLPDVPHVQDPNRVEAARTAVEELQAELILMDDGFQHRRLHRDLNIVVVDSTCPFGFGYLLPRGLLREPVESISRADLVIMTRCDTVQASELDWIEQTVSNRNEQAPILRSNHRPTALLVYPNETLNIQPERVAALSAIGNPAAFEQSLQASGLTVVDSKQLPDHDKYSPQSVQKIRDWIESLGDQIDRVVCTHKDLVKLQTARLGGKPLAALLIELTVVGDRTPLDRMLESTLQVDE